MGCFVLFSWLRPTPLCLGLVSEPTSGSVLRELCWQGSRGLYGVRGFKQGLVICKKRTFIFSSCILGCAGGAQNLLSEITSGRLGYYMGHKGSNLGLSWVCQVQDKSHTAVRLLWPPKRES